MVFLELDGVKIWAGRSSDCAAGRWSLSIEVRGGVIVGIGFTAGAERTGADKPCLPGDVLGARVAGVADGQHDVAMVIGDGK